MDNEPLRIAQVIGKMLGGGVESVVMNYYRNIDRSKIQFDFFIDEDSKIIPRTEIEKLGGRIYIIPPYQKIKAYIKTLIKLFSINKYSIVHSHINALSVFPLLAAKISGVKIRIAHNHSTAGKHEFKKNILKNILRPFSKLFSTHYCACSEYAGIWLFGSGCYKQGKINIIKNAIDTSIFYYDEDIRKKVRHTMEIENNFVIGHVGRFIPQKNHNFIIDIFKEVYKNDKDAILLLIGEGILLNEIKDKINNLGLNNNVKILGIRDDIHMMMNAMDIFLFPSIYEGLGLVAIEAQACSLKVIASEKIPEEACITKYLEFFNLNLCNKLWADKVLYYKKEGYDRNFTYEQIAAAGYDIKFESEKLTQYYFNLYKS